MNELPIMPIRAKYADESAEGKNIDTELDKIPVLQEVVGDENSGLVKDVDTLKDKTQKINYNEGDNTTEIVGALDVGTISADIISSPEGSFAKLNGESNPSVKPIYYHPIFVWGKADGTLKGTSFSLVIIGQKDTAFTSLSELITWCRNNSIDAIAPASGSAITGGDERMIIAWIDILETSIGVRGQLTTAGNIYLQQINISDSDFSQFNLTDRVNKIN